MLRLDWNLLLTIINLIVLYACMKKFLFGPVTAILEKRRVMIQEQLDHASQSETEALMMKSQYEKALSNAGEESGRIVEQAKADAKAEYDRIVKDASHEAGKILRDARSTVEVERQQAQNEMQSQIADLAMTAAEKLLAGQSDGSIYDQFLEGAGGAHDAGGN